MLLIYWDKNIIKNWIIDFTKKSKTENISTNYPYLLIIQYLKDIIVHLCWPLQGLYCVTRKTPLDCDGNHTNYWWISMVRYVVRARLLLVFPEESYWVQYYVTFILKVWQHNIMMEWFLVMRRIQRPSISI